MRHLCSAAILAILIVPASAQTVPSGFTVEPYGGSIPMGTSMAWTPDGRLLVAQQTGTIQVVKGGILQTTPFHTFKVDMPLGSERGLLSIAVDPGFASNGWVYAYLTVPTPAPHNAVRRLQANPTSPDVSDGTETPIVDLEDLGSPAHNGGTIAFGGDGKLYLSTGDNGVASNAQSLTSRFGKILRYNPDGTIPADNPYAFQGISGTPSGEFAAIWAVGLRNPWRMAFQPGTMHLHINDVGEDTWEEINEGTAGLNYGWQGGATDGVRNDPSFTDPIFVYSHTFGTPMGNSITGGVFYNPTAVMFPSTYVGKYFFTDFGTGFIAYTDSAQPGQSFPFLAGASSPVDLSVGPDGALYYLGMNGAAGVYRISYSAPSTPPGTPPPTTTPPPSSTPATDTGKKSNRCGATGLEVLAVLALGALRRKRL